MMTELILVEGVSDVQLISYYLQNVYGWQYKKDNELGVSALDGKEHIESLVRNGYELILCGVGGNGKFATFVKDHQINAIIKENEISSLIVVTDRDEDSIGKIKSSINKLFENLTLQVGQWSKSTFTDGFGSDKSVDTFLMIIPANEKGALERVVINALNDIPAETALIHEVTTFVKSLKEELLPDLSKINKANKAIVGTYFSVRYPKQALRSFSTFISKINWSESDSLRKLFFPFSFLGKEKPVSTELQSDQNSYNS